MRTGLLALLLFAIVITGTRCEESRAQTIQDQPKNPEAEKLAKALVASITTNNYAAYTDLLIVQHDYVNMRLSTDPGDMEKVNDSTRGMQKVHKEARKSFERVRDRGERAGLAWERTRYKSCSYELDTVKGIEFVTMKVIMEFREVEYPITIEGIWRTPKGWRLFGPVEFGDKNSSSIDLARRMMDSIAMADSMMMMQMYYLADSARMADSMSAAHMYWQADSAHRADSVATSTKKKGKKKK
jgi:hypothetical protein